MFLSLLKFKLFKYYIVIILFILLVNVILLFYANFNSKTKKQKNHYSSDVYEERGPNKINKNYQINARTSRHSNVSNEIHREILYELDMLDKYFLVETGSEYIQNKYRDLVNQLRVSSSKQKKKG